MTAAPKDTAEDKRGLGTCFAFTSHRLRVSAVHEQDQITKMLQASVFVR